MALPTPRPIVGLFLSISFAILVFTFLTPSPLPVYAKEKGLTAIELYNGPSGPAYAQIKSFLINGKLELRVCGSSSKITKSGYGKLQKIILNTGSSLEDGSNGVLTLTQGEAGTSVCVVPAGLKFEKNPALAPAETVGQATLGGTILPGGPSGLAAPPPLAPGVKIVFVAQPDVELAEYLRAEHSPSISLWHDYLSKYGAASHAAKAKQSLASLLSKDGENYLEAYHKSSTTHRSYPDLKIAESSAEQALEAVPQYAAALQLKDKIHDDLTKLMDEGRNEIAAYKQALAAHSPGYAHLAAARDLASACATIDPHFNPISSFQQETNKESNEFDARLNQANSLLASKQYDDSFAAIAPYTSFAGEVPGVATVVDSAYQFHEDRAKEAAENKDWEKAVDEYRRADSIKPTSVANAAVKKAELELTKAQNQKAVEAARTESQLFEQDHDYVRAYDVFAKLPLTQKPLAAEDMKRLAPAYIDAAPQVANQIEQAHVPIRGLNDEVRMQDAYGYLQRAYDLTKDPTLKDRADATLRDRADAVGDKLSEYYLGEAKRCMNKPLGTGAGLAWSYLEKALQYKASKLEAIRDARTTAAFPYQMRSHLSVGVGFRDQTSRRDSLGFAEQLGDAIATGLEAADLGVKIKVIRRGDSPPLEPNFQLVGDVVEHRSTTAVTATPHDSHYRVGEHEAPNAEWNKTNREYEGAKEALQTLQQMLSGVVARGKKKQIAEANGKVAAAQKKVDELAVKLDAMPKSLPVDDIKSYNYTERTIEVTTMVELRFRIKDFQDNQKAESIPIKREGKQKYRRFQNVKPEDIDGIKEEGTEPDEKQVLTDVENEARDRLIRLVIEDVGQLPEIIFNDGRKKEEDGDFEGAAEHYILYLNSTRPVETPERNHAESFLFSRFNIDWKTMNMSP